MSEIFERDCDILQANFIPLKLYSRVATQSMIHIPGPFKELFVMGLQREHTETGSKHLENFMAI